MKEILTSVTKIVLLLMVSVLSLVYTIAVIYAVLHGESVLDQIPFKEIMLLVAGFFFAYKGDNSQPYAGK